MLSILCSQQARQADMIGLQPGKLHRQALTALPLHACRRGCSGYFCFPLYFHRPHVMQGGSQHTMATSNLPSVALHRFPGNPRPGRDVDLFEKEGVDFVAAARHRPKGVSFLKLNQQVIDVHAKFSGGCCLTAPDAPLTPGFEMRCVGVFKWLGPTQQDKRNAPRRDDPSPSPIGHHYHLVPLRDMPLSEYIEEMRRLPVVPCSASAAATGADRSCLPDGPEPSDAWVYWVVRALRALSEREPDPTASIAIALHAMTLCACDTPFTDLLEDAFMVNLCLEAMEAFNPPPPDEDLTAASECYEICENLREADCNGGLTQVCNATHAPAQDLSRCPQRLHGCMEARAVGCARTDVSPLLHTHTSHASAGHVSAGTGGSGGRPTGTSSGPARRPRAWRESISCCAVSCSALLGKLLCMAGTAPYATRRVQLQLCMHRARGGRRSCQPA